MKKIVLSTRRSWNWKVFLVLLVLIIPATFAILPFAINLQSAYAEPGTAVAPDWMTLMLNQLTNIVLIGLLGAIGLVLANRIGLGLPFVESWVQGQPPAHRFRSIVAVGMLAGIGFALVILALQIGIFGPPMQAMFQELGIEVPEEAHTPPLYGFLAAISAGITEETLFRLFGLSLLAWLGSLLFRTAEGRPTLAVLWLANILFALAFGAAHLPTAATIGWPINALVVTRTLVLNGIGGLAFGWLFWTYGLESAMLAHFFADVGLHALLPIITMQEGQTATILAGVGVGVVIVLGLVWAARTILIENRAESDQQPQTVPRMGT